MYQRKPKHLKVCGAYVPYLEDTRHGKFRPIVLLNIHHNVAHIMPITSQYKHKSPLLQQWYFPIRHWKDIGLKKPSYVDLQRQLPIPKKYIHFYEYRGYLNSQECISMFKQGLHMEAKRHYDYQQMIVKATLRKVERHNQHLIHHAKNNLHKHSWHHNNQKHVKSKHIHRQPNYKSISNQAILHHIDSFHRE